MTGHFEPLLSEAKGSKSWLLRPEVEQSLSVFKGLCQVQTGEALNYLTRWILMLERLEIKINL
jgi:hypothetical protein